MFDTLPAHAYDLLDWSWADIEPFVRDLRERPLDAATVAVWLADWSRLADTLSEIYSRLYVATTRDTTDATAERRYHTFLNDVFPPAMSAEQELREKLLATGLEPAGFAMPLRGMRVDAALFREANLPLQTEEQKVGNEYNKIIGAQTVVWEGDEVTIPQLRPVYQRTDRAQREQAWRLASERQLNDRAAINELWVKLFELRRRIATNADLPDYRAYAWQALHRFDYTPEDCLRFHDAIAEVVVPAAQRVYERRRQRLGVDTLRPWDLDVDPHGRSPLRPFSAVAELEEHSARILQQVDPLLGDYFATMRREDLLDLANRKGKAPGGYCTSFAVERRPFIFMNAVGLPDDVRTLLHEAGHAFHVFATAGLPYNQQRQAPIEFAEVASMAMELLAAPYLPRERGGFYAADETARARVEHLEEIICFWPYMAVVDAFQHWAYTNPAAAGDPAQCDAQWATLWQRFMAGIDYSGLEEAMVTGWQRKMHIFSYPLYYVEYGLAQLGAVQVWRNALSDQAAAVVAYQRALALGGTVPLPELYATAGARFAFDRSTVSDAVALLEETITSLE